MSLQTLPQYETYKDSGIEWLGKIPTHWSLTKLKNAALINPSLGIKNTELNNYACFLPMEKVESNGQVDYELQKPIQELRRGFTSFRRNDVIIAKITPCFENGKGAFLNLMPTDIGFGSTEFHVLRSRKEFNSSFLYYLSKSHFFMDFGEKLMVGSAGQKRVPTEFLINFLFASPNLIEQTAIAHFLDQKTAQIDAAIAIKEKQIALLKERKQILIQQAVTQGLDPTVPMKDSGVEWIGKIPAHWEVYANRVLFSERIESGREDLPLLSVSIHSGVSSEEISEEENIRGRIKIQDKTKYLLVKTGDIAFNMMRAWQGAIGAVRTEGMVSPAYIVAKPKSYISAEYFEYQYRCPDFIKQMDRFSKGITDFRKRLYWDGFKQLYTIVPPQNEQSHIEIYIEAETEKTNESINLLNQQIEKLREYKTTLINSAVTGKIRVTPEMVATA